MTTLILIGVLLALAFLLVHYKPSVREGFSSAAVDPTFMPACAERSTAAQSLLMRIGSIKSDDAEEFRLLVSKLCCLEGDIAAPGAGIYRTMALQFRTSHDMEPPSTFVGRCLRNAVRERDITLVIQKYETRGRELLGKLLSPCNEVDAEFTEVVARTRLAMTNVCLKEQPSMDRPAGPRDPGYWESDEVAELAQYQGISSAPK
jgi:hypothetical protein